MTQDQERAAGEQKPLFDRGLDAISDATLVICGVALVVLVVIFGWLVFGRYVLNATPTWVEQAALLLVNLIGFLGASVGIHRGTHLGVSYFRERSPAPLQRTFELASHVILAAFGAVMLLHSYHLMVFKWGTEIPLLNLPEGLRAIPIMLCGALMVLYSLGHLRHALSRADDGAADRG